jgi:hypothetical protein
MLLPQLRYPKAALPGRCTHEHRELLIDDDGTLLRHRPLPSGSAAALWLTGSSAVIVVGSVRATW